MRLGIKAKQVAGVTLLVGFAVVMLSAWYLSELARLRLEDTNARARAIAQTISQRAFDAIAAGVDPRTVVQTDAGLQSILTASLLLEDVQYAAITDVNNVVIAHSLNGNIGQTLAPAETLSALLEQGWMSQMRAIYTPGGRTYEFSQDMSLAAGTAPGTTDLGTIHVGVSTLLIRPALEESLKTPLYTALAVLVIATVVAMLLAQVVLRPIHVIRSGLARLGRGEFDVQVDLPPEAELEDLGDSFKAISARLAADQAQLAGQKETLESVVESTLNSSRRLAALGRLSAGIAHEVKNPLNATMIHLELLKMKVGEMPDALEHVQVIAAQVRRLDEVMQGFLKFMRPEDLELQATAVAPLIEGLMPIISAEAGKSNVDVHVDVPTTLPLVSADPVMLQQAFLNLALNACQAMPDGGKLRISATPRAGRRVDILVEDTGVGIPPEHLEKIFNLYFTTKERGSGIGLSMVYRTIQLHDGEIEVQSVKGSGTRFRVTLRQA